MSKMRVSLVLASEWLSQEMLQMGLPQQQVHDYNLLFTFRSNSLTFTHDPKGNLRFNRLDIQSWRALLLLPCSYVTPFLPHILWRLNREQSFLRTYGKLCKRKDPSVLEVLDDDDWGHEEYKLFLIPFAAWISIVAEELEFPDDQDRTSVYEAAKDFLPSLFAFSILSQARPKHLAIPPNKNCNMPASLFTLLSPNIFYYSNLPRRMAVDS